MTDETEVVLQMFGGEVELDIEGQFTMYNEMLVIDHPLKPDDE